MEVFNIRLIPVNAYQHVKSQLPSSTSFWDIMVIQRQEEHRKEVESISNRTFTRSDRKSRAAEINKSAITDHVAKENHVINWSGANILERGHRKTRQVKESICIRKEPNCMNRDGGAYTVQHTDSLWPSFGHVVNITWPQAWWSRRWRAKRRN